MKRLVRTPTLWFAGLAVAAIGTLATSLVTGIAQNWFNVAAISDVAAAGPAIQLVTAIDTGPFGWTTTQSLTLDTVAQEPEDYEAGAAWWHSLGATPLQEESVSLILEGGRADPVQIVDLSAHVDWCGEPTAGTLLFSPAEGSSDAPDLAINLDKDDHRLAENQGPTNSAAPSAPYFNSHSISLARGEKLSLHITADAVQAHMCRWRLAATEAVDGHTETQIFDPVFAVSGDLGTSKYTTLYGSTVLIHRPSPETIQSPYYPADYPTFCDAVKHDGETDCESLTA